MPYSRVAAVTGGNRGIGLAIVRQIALGYRSSRLNNGPLLLYLCARTARRGEDAVQALLKDPELRESGIFEPHAGRGPLVDIQPKILSVDKITGEGGIEAFVSSVAEDCKSEAQGTLDVLVNNAGVFIDGQGVRVVRDTLQTNYYGTMALTERMLPHMSRGGRIVTLASRLGKPMGKYSAEVADAFRSAATASSVEATTELIRAYEKSIGAGTTDEDGWPTSAYVASKTGVIAATSCLGRLEQQRTVASQADRVLVNSCCPGYVKTELTSWRGRKSVNDGAVTPVILALGDIGGVGGEYWEDDAVTSW